MFSFSPSIHHVAVLLLLLMSDIYISLCNFDVVLKIKINQCIHYIYTMQEWVWKKNQFNSLLWKFFKSWKKETLQCELTVFSLPPLWPEFPLSRLVMPPSVARPFSAVTWRISEVSPVIITFYSYTMVYSSVPYCAHVACALLLFSRFVFRIDFRVKLEHQIVKDISWVMEICTQWFKYRFSCTGFIKKNRPHDK